MKAEKTVFVNGCAAVEEERNDQGVVITKAAPACLGLTRANKFIYLRVVVPQFFKVYLYSVVFIDVLQRLVNVRERRQSQAWREYTTCRWI